MDQFPSSTQIDVAPPRLPAEVHLRLDVRDPEVIAELVKRAEGPQREAFAQQALRLGVLAIRQASGALDTAAIQRAAERVLVEVDKLVTGNANDLTRRITGSLQEYFDPQNGRLVERLDRLVRKDGELATMLSGHLDGDSCTLTRTLVKHIGEHSPLLQVLSPEKKDGLLAKLERCLNDALTTQQQTIIAQFSLDEPNSALSRLVANITDGNGQLRKDLAEDIKTITNEFSKDNADSLISKLTLQLAQTHDAVKQSLTLDRDDSPLAVLRRELLKLIKDQSDASQEFQKEVRQTLGFLAGKKEEATRGHLHGVEFQSLVGEVLSREAQSAGDLCELTANSAGIIPRSKVGDHVITLGPESLAAGTRIVVECKDETGYTETNALSELATARQNRDAQIAIFVFSKETAPPDLPPLRRVGSDIICAWDRSDPQSDLVLKCAISVARALVVRERLVTQRAAADFSAIDKSIATIEKKTAKLGDVLTWAQNIMRDGKKIADAIDPLRDEIAAQVEQLRQTVADLKQEQAQ